MSPASLRFLKSQPFRIRWNVHNFHKVTKWKFGCIYETKSIGYVVCSPEYAMDMRIAHKDIQVGPPPTSLTRELL